MSEMENTNTQVLTTVATETPPVPRKRKADRKSAHQGALADRPMTVYDSLFEYCLSIPISRISHLPAAKEQAILCPQHTETGKCNEGDECSAVHADIEGLEKMTIHINYAWRSPEHVTYARLPAGEFLTVLAPNNRPPTDTIESHFVLSTKGSLNRQQVIDGRPMSHCAHYYFNRVCNRGEHCSFIHAITIDPLAEDGQRAPAPQVVHRNSKATPTGAALPAASEPESVPPTVVVTQPLEAKLLAAEPVQGALNTENSGYHSDSSACSMSIKSSKSTTSARSEARTDSVRVDSYVRFTDDAYDGSTSQPTPCTYETVCGTRVLLLYNHEIIGYRHNPYFGLNHSLQCGL